MPIMEVTLAATLAWGPLVADTVDYFHRDLAAVTAGAQCHYANGARAALLKTKNPRRRLFVYRERSRVRDGDTLELMEFEPNGQYHHDSNGGVTMHHMIRMAVDHLLTQRYQPLKPKDLDTFLGAPNVPKCGRATFDADLYDDRTTERW